MKSLMALPLFGLLLVEVPAEGPAAVLQLPPASGSPHHLHSPSRRAVKLPLLSAPFHLQKVWGFSGSRDSAATHSIQILLEILKHILQFFFLLCLRLQQHQHKLRTHGSYQSNDKNCHPGPGVAAVTGVRSYWLADQQRHSNQFENSCRRSLFFVVTTTNDGASCWPNDRMHVCCHFLVDILNGTPSFSHLFLPSSLLLTYWKASYG